MTLIDILKLFFICVILILFPFGLYYYSGNNFYYFLFTIISAYALITSFNEDSISFESFFSLLIWLGFWFKFTVQISFLNSQFPEGSGLFDYKPESFDKILIISIISIFGFLLAKYVRLKFIFNYKNLNKSNFNIDNYLFFYLTYRKKIIIIYFLLILFLSIINLIFVFFQKGTVPETFLPYGINNIINWLLMFGFASLSSILIFFEFSLKKKNSNNLLKYGIFETFISSISVLSRAMIFNSTSLAYGYYKLVELSNIKVNKINFLKFFLLIIILFLISLIVVSKLRQNKDFPIGHEVHSYIPKIKIEVGDTKNQKKLIPLIEETNKFLMEFDQIIFLAAGRWVGIEGVMTVYSNENMGWKMFKKAFKDKFDYSNSFYENYIKGSKHSYKENPRIYTVYVPGIVGFLYYTHSLLFLFLGIFTLCIICSYIEFVAFKVAKNNIVFSYLIGNVLAYRLIHFGYMPQSTYKILMAILINFILIIVMFKLLDFLKK